MCREQGELSYIFKELRPFEIFRLGTLVLSISVKPLQIFSQKDEMRKFKILVCWYSDNKNYTFIEIVDERVGSVGWQ